MESKTGKCNHMPSLQERLLEYRKEKGMKITHGFSKTSFYRVWASMKGRCADKNKERSKNYGGRGISVCKEWLNFINFKNDMYADYLKHKTNHSKTTLERISVNGNYCPENCRWATMDEQSLNRQKLRLYKEPSLEDCAKVINKRQLICKRCGHIWWQRNNAKPKMCPICKSRKWYKTIEK